jgi:predicted amidohydrolase
LVAATATGGAVCFGLVEEAAARPFITQVIASGGEIVVVHRKAHLPDDEAPHYQPGTGSGVFTIGRVRCSVAVCAEIGTARPYQVDSRVVLGPAAPGLYGERRRDEAAWRRGFEWWSSQVSSDAHRLLRGDQCLAVSTQAGATDDEDFPGGAALVGPGGVVREALPDWHEGFLVVNVG